LASSCNKILWHSERSGLQTAHRTTEVESVFSRESAGTTIYAKQQALGDAYCGDGQRFIVYADEKIDGVY